MEVNENGLRYNYLVSYCGPCITGSRTQSEIREVTERPTRRNCDPLPYQSPKSKWQDAMETTNSFQFPKFFWLIVGNEKIKGKSKDKVKIQIVSSEKIHTVLEIREATLLRH
jgi:hypothetical protein